jgi:DNA replication protein DnaC
MIAPSIRKRVENVIEGIDPWPLVLVGGVGTGKTCTAGCMLDLAAGQRIYKTVPQLAEDLVLAGKGELSESGYPVSTSGYWARWREAALVVLDELGTRERASDFVYESVKRAIDERQDMPAVFISNLGLDDLAKVFDDRVSSRLAQGTVIHFDGPDRRLRR